MKLILGIVCALTLSACMSSNHTMPDGKRLDRYRRAAQAVFQPELDALDADLAAGRISPGEHVLMTEAVEQKIIARAADAAWTKHAMAETQRKIHGIPTPDSPQNIPIPVAGMATGGVPNQGTYRRFNDSDIGYSTSGQIAREFFKGYTPGQSLRGKQTAAY
ncbi:MAG: hypothetical protein JNJ83_12450 [Verrucomicrobiaceae bacterium]|nr:hypothetical protein [Verrucomicrobiaceae bacterium]